MSQNASKFLNLFNHIESLLKKKLNIRYKQQDYSSIIREAKNTGIISDDQFNRLYLVGNLRNAIVHDNNFNFPEDPIADPHPEIITWLEKIKDFLENPPTIQNLPVHEVKIFQESDDLFDCIAYMHQHDYSQVIIFSGKEYGLITREDIARWFEMQIEGKDLIISIENQKIKELNALDFKDQCKFLSRNSNLLDLLDIFKDNNRTKIAAVLITENGKNTNKPINIFTYWDLPEIIKKIELY